MSARAKEKKFEGRPPSPLLDSQDRDEHRDTPYGVILKDVWRYSTGPKEGHQLRCSAYERENCPCFDPAYRVPSAGNYPFNPNPPGRAPRMRDSL